MIDLARRGSPEGLWLRAKRQSAGRGRQGRAWLSGPGNLHVSTIVRLRASDPPPATLALVAAVALEEAVAVFGITGLSIKWPNDLLRDDAKLAGILLERADDAVVIGFGVNCAQCPDLPDRRAADLGGAVDPAMLAETLAEAFGRWIERWRGEGLATVRRRWLERAHAPGTALTVRLPDGSAFDGLFGGLDTEGALILRLADGSARVIHAGDVFLI